MVIWRNSSTVESTDDRIFNDMACIMTEVLGKPIRFREVPGPGYKASLMQHGFSEPSPKAMLPKSAKASTRPSLARPRTTTPTAFRQWCEEVLRPAVGGLS